MVQAPLTVTCFLQCVTDRLCPEVAEATVRILEAGGARVVIPDGQHCCGLPAIDAGDLATARRMARHTIAALESSAADYVVTPGASCAVTMIQEYPGLFTAGSAWRTRAERVASRVVDLTTLLARTVRVPASTNARPATVESATIAAGPQMAVTYHPFCQSLNVLGVGDAPRELIERTLGLELRELPEANVCCGFGGSTSFDHPAVASRIAARKLANVAATGAGVLVTDNPGCLLHLRGAAQAAGMPIRVVHVAELVAEHLGLPAAPGQATAPD